ncbi:response regulator transcription factor [Bacillus xiapuensis]|uniref:response regulator transcription factor n=1 Tax=Bacillus xiapuensis TaxID=2014075 RepID=UPI000C23BF1F|nr:response regulator transcription factor [Bacillus xiapuensis]
MVRILVAEDDPHIQRLLSIYLKPEGFDVIQAYDGEEALNKMYECQPELLVLDLMMPKMDGVEVCKQVRIFSEVPILMVTAKGERADKLIGFQCGADDYIVKPFDPMELVMRVKALLRRYRIAWSHQLHLGEVLLDKLALSISCGGQSIILPQKEFALLHRLASYPGKIFTRAQLIEQIWGMDYEGDERTVDVHIKRIRQRIRPFDEQVEIVTVRGLGYRLEVNG